MRRCLLDTGCPVADHFSLSLLVGFAEIQGVEGINHVHLERNNSNCCVEHSIAIGDRWRTPCQAMVMWHLSCALPPLYAGCSIDAALLENNCA